MYSSILLARYKGNDKGDSKAAMKCKYGKRKMEQKFLKEIHLFEVGD
jgi:hypothetical protein